MSDKSNTSLEKQSNKLGLLDDNAINTLVEAGVVPENTPTANIEIFQRFCAETNLSPFKRQVHLVKRWSKQGDRYTIQTGIDGYRAVANRTGVYAGNDDYLFDDSLTQFQHLETGKKHPTTATSTVYKLVGGQRVAFSATAGWNEYFPGETQGFMWQKMPYLMIGKCSEALALRKAFPEELSGIYTDEEMQQADVAPTAIDHGPDDDYTPQKMSEKEKQKIQAKEKVEAKKEYDASADERVITLKQVKFIWTIGRKNDWPDDEIKRVIEAHGYDSTKNVMRKDMESIIDTLKINFADIDAVEKEPKEEETEETFDDFMNESEKVES